MLDLSEAIRRADSHAVSIPDAIRELNSSLDIKSSALTLFFCANHYGDERFEEAIHALQAPGLVIGCTSAGEIGGSGYANKSITAMSFSEKEFKASAHLITNLKDVTAEQVHGVITQLKSDLANQGIQEYHACFALLLVDGMSIAEEPLAYRLQDALGEIPLVGGSAGDEMLFETPKVFLNGEFHSNTAVVALVYTERPWEVFKEQHFRPTDNKVVVTAADPENRIVKELNGELAAVEYANMIGLASADELTTEHFASNPLMLMLADAWYIRSPQKANPDGSLSLFCSIDEGLVLALGQGVDMVDELEASLNDISSRIGPIAATIACDCIQRRLELENTNMLDRASSVLTRFNAVGFSTYGEQFGALHVNQTLTGIAIG